jgi:hypothetical protein
MSAEAYHGIEQMVFQNTEKQVYLDTFLRPIVTTYVRNYRKQVTNAKCWRLCDMWFTAFLINEKAEFLWWHIDNGHAQYMEALRAWYEALNRDEADYHEQYQLEHDVPPRVHDAEKILATLVAGRSAMLQETHHGLGQNEKLPHTRFDTLVVEAGKHCDKPCKLYCLLLTHIVQNDCQALYPHLMDFKNKVTCSWFDSINTDTASVFVNRANAWFLRNTDYHQLLEYAGMEPMRDLSDNDPDKARENACRPQTSITSIKNQYFVAPQGAWRDRVLGRASQ